MAKISVTSNEFADIVISFLLDKIMHSDEIIPDNEIFNDLSEKMRSKGMRSVLLQYYFDMDTNSRVKYKRIKGVFDNSSSNKSVIEIVPEAFEVSEPEEPKDGIIKKAVKIAKALLLKQGNEKLTDSELERIVEEISIEVNEDIEREEE